MPKQSTPIPCHSSSRLFLKTYEPFIQHYGTFFSAFPWQAYCTGTYRKRLSRLAAEETFRVFIRLLERKLKCRLAYVAVPERTTSGLGKPAGPWHWHFVLCGPAHKAVRLLEQASLLWTKFYGNAHVLAFDPTRNGSRYLAKTAAQIGFDYYAENLTLFGKAMRLDLFEDQQLAPYVPDHVRHKVNGQSLAMRPCAR